MKTFTVSKQLTVRINIDVDAFDLEEAEEKALEQIEHLLQAIEEENEDVSLVEIENSETFGIDSDDSSDDESYDSSHSDDSDSEYDEEDIDSDEY
jgi:predicted secreted protein